ncbi:MULTISPECIES: N-acetylglucosamine-6-phosphate deacetylase [unclassified Curtobacterium]|uniref:N-acetylglucosamine-6-phosphate deacetylase n=1 Tax=unclassified Curtobacterium TaxID=257496 RepID=UPI000F46D702|nr:MULTISPECIES: N-acetylglucosamine-6-phosphate deacetylase [unclassified Curtobacterium]ROQ05080.1 N-acetylglucosamine-6-phosphate deacetylase [Curtobacterium sp. PhB171]ROQ22281.1 N-acetylglucosamine-6-phosphate deacetylase [Curtobacterium sp. PhB170]ROS33641.1 N-acetylglucosamine-6-phosphate deacetylase [Curtobacterium sp. PhB131]ROS64960.1 N-acetylglucosamine-6-phosphate deacetylase [Curtobacterium sp. PhB141]
MTATGLQAGREAQHTLVRASRVVDAAGSTADGWVLLAGDVVHAIGSGPEAPAADQVVDLGDAVLTPGFIDLHGHGGATESYEDDSFARSLAVHRAHGTTRSVLSLVANPVSALADSLARIRAVMAADPLVLGVHLEGPFLSPHNKGAHNESFLIDPSPAAVDALLEAGEGVIRQVTIAPELPGALDAVRRFVAAGVTVAVGHTVGTYDQARAAFDAGATLLTHAFNAMPGLHHRAPGPIGAAVADDRVTLELILDAVHVHPVVADTLLRAAPGRLALITDAMGAAGAADGSYRLGSLDVTVTDGVAHVAGTDTIAGSTLTQDVALQNAVSLAGRTLPEAVAALTSVPAAALGLGDRLGRLAPGYAADLVALSPALEVQRVWGGGRELR